MSCVGAFDCSAQSFHQSLPLSLRRAPLPPCLAHCNKAFALSLWCLCCFAAPLHCSPSVKARRRVSERMHPFHCMHSFLVASSGYGASTLRDDYLYNLLSSPVGEYEPLFPWGFRNGCQGTSLMNLYCFHCSTNQSSILFFLIYLFIFYQFLGFAHVSLLIRGVIKRLLSSHRVQNNRDAFFLSHPFPFLRQQPQLSQFNLNAMLLAPGLFDYPQTGSCAGFHSFHHALTSVSWLPCRILREVILVPLPYADDFGCLFPV